MDPPPAYSSSISRIVRGSSSRELSPGQLIDGKYRLVEPLGRGGMSQVWSAHHEALKTKLAIKFVDEKLIADDEVRKLSLERFRFEAQISASLGRKTKHVVAVQDASLHEGTPYLVMELIAGHTLEQEIDQKGPVDPYRLAAILQQVCGALSVAHDSGIVHRDIKPSNIVLVDTTPGELFVKLADFGVAKATSRNSTPFDRPTETNQGFMVGSPAFMSPEQLRGGAEVDARTDVWGIGVVAYEALTGSLPFVGVTEADLIVLISTGTLEPLAQKRPELPAAAALDGWFAKALAKEPDDRFATARDAAAAFMEALEPSAPPVIPKRGGWVIPAIGVAGAAMLVAVFAALTHRAPPSVPVQALSTAVAESPAPPPEHDAPASQVTPPVAETPSEAKTASPEASSSAAPEVHRGRRGPRAVPAAPKPADKDPYAGDEQQAKRREINPSEIQ